MRAPRDSERRAIYVFLIIIAVMLIIAAYGCMTGAWEPLPT